MYADLSSLIDYCIVYLDDERYAEKFMDYLHDDGGDIVTSASSRREIHERIGDRFRVIEYLIDKATEYFNDESLSATDFKAEILRVTTIEQATGVDFNKSYLQDLECLEELLDKQGLDAFRIEIDYWRQQSNRLRSKLFNKVLNDEGYTRGGQSEMMVQIGMGQITDDSSKIDCLINAAFWAQDGSGNIIVSCNGDIGNNKDQIVTTISRITRQPPNVVTTKEAAEAAGLT